MCLAVTLLSLHNADYVLAGPVASSPMALIDSKARRIAPIRLSQTQERNQESAGQVECKRVFVSVGATKHKKHLGAIHLLSRFRTNQGKLDIFFFFFRGGL